ncbi:hypothetical protein LTT66_34215 [Nocardia gipuzkoensis]|uniref:hypothetical protein n=1 Tax=Nocardia gipuzkoensis TaxID=2749991 RepID=UPI001E3E90A0|nr:hypothetical protein [Nocardia gipuzkoensis]UGT68159.1 hypothetical protein LTT66_34215 [Nocardia gipuzkoensis]
MTHICGKPDPDRTAARWLLIEGLYPKGVGMGTLSASAGTDIYFRAAAATLVEAATVLADFGCSPIDASGILDRLHRVEHTASVVIANLTTALGSGAGAAEGARLSELGRALGRVVERTRVAAALADAYVITAVPDEVLEVVMTIGRCAHLTAAALGACDQPLLGSYRAELLRLAVHAEQTFTRWSLTRPRAGADRTMELAGALVSVVHAFLAVGCAAAIVIPA